MYIISMAANQLVDRYPDRFNATDLKIFDSNNTLVGEANADGIMDNQTNMN